MDSHTMLTAALQFADHGIPVFPVHTPIDGTCDCSAGIRCESPGKHPRTVHGVKDASAEPDQIREWWRCHPQANIGYATGAASGILVLDCDGPEGKASLRGRHLPVTTAVLTGRTDGFHYCFKHPGGEVRSRTGILRKVDVRGDGGYVVAPPSQHVSGQRYQWAEGLTPREVGFADPPDWLLGLLRQRNGGARDRRSPEDWRGLAAQGIEEGARHSELCRLAGFVFGSNLDRDVGEKLLLAWNDSRCRPPLPRNEAEKVISDIREREDGEGDSARKTDFFSLALSRRLG